MEALEINFRSWVANDCAVFMAQFEGVHRRPPKNPAEVLPWVLTVLYQYRIERVELATSRCLISYPKKTIYLDKKLGPAQVNWVLARSLGHFQIHARSVRYGRFSPYELIEADAYASAFLMPRPLLVKYPHYKMLQQTKPAEVKKRVALLLSLAELFDVSGEVARRAFQTLGLLRDFEFPRAERAGKAAGSVTSRKAERG